MWKDTDPTVSYAEIEGRRHSLLFFFQKGLIFMRLWHKDLIPYLPRQQLVAQWRECCCIARNIYHDGTPNHLLVNKILDYPDEEFNTYTSYVIAEMQKRGYSVRPDRFWQWRRNKEMSNGRIFEGWHNVRYMRQCYSNLMEKYDCGGIPEDEWKALSDFVQRVYF